MWQFDFLNEMVFQRSGFNVQRVAGVNNEEIRDMVVKRN